MQTKYSRASSAEGPRYRATNKSGNRVMPHLAFPAGATSLHSSSAGSEISIPASKKVPQTGKPAIPTSDPIIRAVWNFFLIEGDGSFGIHNPRFARTVLLATLDALK